MHIKAKLEELIEITDENGNKEFLVCQSGKWVSIDQEEYNKILEGKNNDNI